MITVDRLIDWSAVEGFVKRDYSAAKTKVTKQRLNFPLKITNLQELVHFTLSFILDSFHTCFHELSIVFSIFFGELGLLDMGGNSRLIDWLIDLSTDHSTDRLIDWLIDLSTDHSTDRLIDWFICWQLTFLPENSSARGTRHSPAQFVGNILMTLPLPECIQLTRLFIHSILPAAHRFYLQCIHCFCHKCGTGR